jgi:hypothetical protein
MNPEVRRARDRGPSGPLGFVWDSVRMGWRWLVRMRTALYLLGLLGVETLLATVIPQAPNVPGTVAAWREGAEGPGAGVAAFFDVFGLFDLYGSTLFLVTLFLLYLSLTACMIPRVRAWVRLVRRSVPPVSRAPHRQQVVAQFASDRDPDEVHAAARELLGARRRWRVRPAAPSDDAAATTAGVGREGPVVARGRIADLPPLLLRAAGRHRVRAAGRVHRAGRRGRGRTRLQRHARSVLEPGTGPLVGRRRPRRLEARPRGLRRRLGP